ncbi:sorting nexin-20 isoform X2 [Harmonia axyridis]|uniref:sorting nexin-20 isoform X2 n=1 Tax=Harmonia axyridis TaxID=115357 RepID=UPI001E279CF8|nr:sorting nexin-20 isoform X2 [Harmonia axyridis]XP_045470159.1 sorting nexin-20 isoform X2 [Harmonia axyridis]
MTQISANDRSNLVFEIISARIHDEDKKYVVYNLQVRHISGFDDLSPSLIERRYTHFLSLYNSLKMEYPDLMVTVEFPKKVLLGNFDNSLISSRSTGFETMLKYVSSNNNLRNSKSLLVFLQEPELTKAKDLLERKEFNEAFPILEANFLLLNKVFTDRSPAVLISLCRLLGCGVQANGIIWRKWAELALHRYEGVSDSDLLALYVPLMQLCLKYELNREDLERRLLDLSKTGFMVSDTNSLLSEVDKVEKKILNLT